MSFRSRPSSSDLNILHTCSWTKNGSRNGESLRLKSPTSGNPTNKYPTPCELGTCRVWNMMAISSQSPFSRAAGLLILHQAGFRSFTPFLLASLPQLWGLLVSPLPGDTQYVGGTEFSQMASWCANTQMWGRVCFSRCQFSKACPANSWVAPACSLRVHFPCLRDSR